MYLIDIKSCLCSLTFLKHTTYLYIYYDSCRNYLLNFFNLLFVLMRENLLVYIYTVATQVVFSQVLILKSRPDSYLYYAS